MSEEITLWQMISEIPHLEGKIDMLDTIICLTTDPNVVEACNDLIKYLLDAPIYQLAEVV